MHQYRITKLLRLINTNSLTAELDLGFNIKTVATFRVARITEPALDLDSEDDPAVNQRRAVIAWLKSAPKPLTVQMYKEGAVYTGDVLDKNGNLLSEEVLRAQAPDETVSIDYGLSMATKNPGGLG